MEVFPDPHRSERLYQVDVLMHVSDDGGETWNRVGNEHKHVDHHALAFDPDDPDYLISGTDGGIYESWDRGATWRFVSNLPITQFYVGATQGQNGRSWLAGVVRPTAPNPRPNSW